MTVPWTNKAQADAGELSFGIELEFMFYYQIPKRAERTARNGTLGPGEINIAPAEEALLPPVLSLPPEYRDLSENMAEAWMDEDDPDTNRGWATGLIEQAILSVPGGRIDGKAMPGGATNPYLSMYVVQDYAEGEHTGWTIKNDGSVRDTEFKIPGYHALSFEVTSPALWDRPESHRHIYRVIQELTRRFRLRINVRTGFHCHVGAGAVAPDNAEDDAPTPGVEKNGWIDHELRGKKHSLGVFKRAAALMWAADGFLSYAHPPERALNVYSQPIRIWSRLSIGLEAREVYVITEAGDRVKKIKEVLLSNASDFSVPTKRLPEHELPSHNFPRFASTETFPAGRPKIRDEEARNRLKKMTDISWWETVPEPANRTVDSGIGHIMNCRNRAAVAMLFSTPSGMLYDRLNYNLRNYRNDKFHIKTTGTVEFREAAGTLSAEWASAWSNICLGFFRFARAASEERFWAVIDKLAQAEAAMLTGRPAPHAYDMISLLFDMGLFAEGLYLERKLRQDPLMFWYPDRLYEKTTDSGSEEPTTSETGSSSGPPSELASWKADEEADEYNVARRAVPAPAPAPAVPTYAAVAQSKPTLKRKRKFDISSSSSSSLSSPPSSTTSSPFVDSPSEKTRPRTQPLPPSITGPPEAVKAWRERFPRGCRTVKTSGEGLLCGLRALAGSLREQLNIQDVSLYELQAVARCDAIRSFEAALGEHARTNINYFSVDQLSAILHFWAKKRGLKLRLGYHLADGQVFLTPYDVSERTWVVWIHCTATRSKLRGGCIILRC